MNRFLLLLSLLVVFQLTVGDRPVNPKLKLKTTSSPIVEALDGEEPSPSTSPSVESIPNPAISKSTVSPKDRTKPSTRTKPASATSGATNVRTKPSSTSGSHTNTRTKPTRGSGVAGNKRTSPSKVVPQPYVAANSKAEPVQQDGVFSEPPKSLVGWLSEPKPTIEEAMQREAPPSLPDKPGFCGSAKSYGIKCMDRLDQCNEDHHCPGATKCCMVGECGYLCVKAQATSPKSPVKTDHKKTKPSTSTDKPAKVVVVEEPPSEGTKDLPVTTQQEEEEEEESSITTKPALARKPSTKPKRG